MGAAVSKGRTTAAYAPADPVGPPAGDFDAARSRRVPKKVAFEGDGGSSSSRSPPPNGEAYPALRTGANGAATAYDASAARTAAARAKAAAAAIAAFEDDESMAKPRPLAIRTPARGTQLERQHLEAGVPQAQPLLGSMQHHEMLHQQLGVQPAALRALGGASENGSTFTGSMGSPNGRGSVGGSRRFKKRFGDVEVGVPARKAVLHWVRHARKRLKVKKEHAEAEAAERREDRAKKRRRRARTDKLIELYAKNAEEVERLCYDEPETMILTQIELLTRRIDDITARKAIAARPQDPAKAFADAVVGGGGSRNADRDAKALEDQRRRELEFARAQAKARMEALTTTWEDAFDRAMDRRKHWERDHGQVQRYAAAEAARARREREEEAAVAAASAVPAALGAASPGDSVLAQLRIERERLAALLITFDSKMRKQKLRKEEHVINEAEALRDEQRAAMDEQARKLRERRRLEREQEEQRRREEAEEEERRKRAAAEEERRRLMAAEEKARLAEEAAEETERRRQAAEAERQRREEEEEMHRLIREVEEEERRRREQERREREAAAERLEREAAESRRRQVEELEQRRRAAEQEKVRAEEARRAEEERQKAEERRRRAAEREAVLDSVFDELEQACDDEDDGAPEATAAGGQGAATFLGHDAALDAALLELTRGSGVEPWGTPPGTPPLEASWRDPFSAFAGIEEEENEEPEDQDRRADSPRTPKMPPEGPGADWMARAMAALGGDGDDSEGSEGHEAGLFSGGGAGDGDGDGDAAAIMADDLELLKFTEAIAERIELLHGW